MCYTVHINGKTGKRYTPNVNSNKLDIYFIYSTFLLSSTSKYFCLVLFCVFAN